MAMDQELHTPETDEQRRRRRRPLLIGGALVGVVIVAVLAFGVFGVQTLFIDDTVEEAGPVFDSGAGAAPESGPDSTGPAEGSDDEPAAAPDPDAEPEVEEAPTTTVPAVVEAARGSFEARDHPGEGTAVVLTDGQQTFVRFDEDFSTDNGPDLFVLVVADGETIELGRLKGNQGSQNYELPSDIDPATVTEVSVWCKRFDSTFTVAALG
jgi:hypothetical protein